MQKTWARLLSDERGASLVEYALLVTFVAIAAFAAVAFFGNELNSSYSDITTSMP